MKTALTGVRELETLYDIPHADKLRMLRAAVSRHPELSDEVAITARRLERFHSHPKYQVFYEIRPLLDWLKSLGKPDTLSIDVLTRATVVALRVTTLLRSGDLQNLVNHVYCHSGGHYVVARDKNNRTVWARVDGLTRDLVLEYIYRHRDTPAPYMFRNRNNPSLCIGVQRIAKYCLIAMEGVGINTRIFKAHSIRGATATFLLSLGVEKSLVKSRGNWSSEKCMDRYYSRLHNLIPWDKVLHTQVVPGLHELVDNRGQPLDEACPLGAALGPEVAWQPQPRAKPDGRGEGNEAQATHQEDMPVHAR